MLIKKVYENYIQNYSNKKVVLFGASTSAITFLSMYKGSVYCFCDNDTNKTGSLFLGYKVISPVELKNFDEDICIIITSMYFYSIKKQLATMGFTNNVFTTKEFMLFLQLDITNKDPFYNQFIFDSANLDLIHKNNDLIQVVSNMLEDNDSKNIYDHIIQNRKFGYKDYSNIASNTIQYFDEDFLNFDENEVYIDAGAAFDTAFDFITRVDGSYKKIYCFEPDTLRYESLKINFKQRNIPQDRFEVLPFGIYSKNTQLDFFNTIFGTSTAGGSFFVVESLQKEAYELDKHFMTKIEVKKLDDIIKDKITYLKMDIEGSELEAIIGAKELIKKYKPKLAICLYHKTQDLWEIPLKIKELVPEYKFYIRHYSNDSGETVLYALL